MGSECKTPLWTTMPVYNLTKRSGVLRVAGVGQCRSGIIFFFFFFFLKLGTLINSWDFYQDGKLRLIGNN